ncbi:MAG: 7TM diverse intracellular signaling domain-containing protein [Desulfurivibrionaceae bacterium]|nr:7TM diverse intracellular signaling domain-containing protein [Desulfurivibrionaceae bacterium]
MKLPCRFRSSIPLLLAALFLLAPFAGAPAQARTLEVVEGTASYPAGLHLAFLEDTRSTFTLSDILSPDLQEQFQPSRSKMPGFGFSQSSMWGKLTIKNNLTKAIEYFLVIDYPPLDHLDFYYPAEEGYGVYQTGDKHPFASRPIKSANYVFPILLEPGQQATYYLRCQTKGSLNLPVRLEAPAYFSQESALTATMLGIYYGILLVMTICVSFLYLWLRDIIYGYYVLFIFSFLAFQVSLNGTGFQYLWPNAIWWNSITVPFFIFLSYTSATLFTISILETKKHLPRYHKLLMALIPFGCLGMLASIFADYSLAIKLATLSCLTLPVMIIAGFQVMLLGYRPAYYYALAWTVSLLAITIYSLKTFGLLANSFLITWSTQIGTSWEVMILALAVADRFHLMEKEKKRALKVNAEMLAEANINLEISNFKLEELNIELEERIMARTRELKTSNDLLTIEARERRAAEKEATHASQSKSDFLANMSHEIRTPMNAIIGMSALALQLPLTSRLHNYLQTIRRAGNSLMRIIDDILDFSKIEAGKLEFEEVAFNLQNLLDNLVNIFTEKVQDKGIEFIVYADCSVPRNLLGDPLRLEQVLINLVANGIKFTDRGEVALHVSCTEEDATGATLCFAVADTGIGLSREQTDHLFTAFHQADTSITRQYGGTGLGLAISQQLAALMHGSITVTTAVGRGATFLFTGRFGKGAATSLPSPLPAPAACVAKTILAAHAHARSRRAWQEILQERGFTVITLPSVADIPRIFTQEEGRGIDLILADSGEGPDLFLQAMATLKERNVARPVALSLADSQTHLRQKAEQLGVEFFLARPFKQNDLLMTVAQGLSLIERHEPLLPSQPATLPTFHGAKILVAEDNKINQEVISEILKNARCQVLLAQNGRQAVDLLETEEDIDCILMDLQMPLMDGFQATSAIRNHSGQGHIPIIALTAHSIAGDRQRCLQAGMDDYVPKPIDQDFLYATMAKYLAHEQEERPFFSHDREQSGLLPETLPGLKIQAGLKRVSNNARFYGTLLHDFRREFQNGVQKLATLLGGDHYGQAEMLVHGIKGVAANLAAFDLEAKAQELEEVLAQGRPPSAGALGRFNASLALVLTSIASLPGEAEDQLPASLPAVEERPLDLSVISPLVRDFKEMVQANDLDAEAAMTHLIKQLGHLPALRPLLLKIKEQLDLFDFRGTLLLVEQLSETISTLPEKKSAEPVN